MKKFISLCLALVLAIALAVPAAAAETPDVSVMVNGENVTFPDGNPEISGGRTMVPMRAVLETLGAEVEYTHETKTVKATLGDIALTHVIGTDKIALEGGEDMTMDTASYVSGGSTLVPLRFFSQALGYEVYWDAGQRTAVVVDKQGLIAEMDKAFTILNDLQAKQTPAAGENLAMEMDFSGNAKITAPGMEMELPFSMDLSGIYGEKAMNISGKMDLSILSLVLASVAMPADGAAASPEETAAALEQMTELLKNLDFEMIYSGGSMWMKLPAVTDLLRAQGAEIPEGTVWMDLGGADMEEVLSLYDFSLTSARGVTMGEVLYAMAEMADAEMPALIYEDAAEAASMLTIMMGDDTFTKEGDTYTWKMDQAMMDKLAESLGEESVEFPGAMEMTVKEDGSCAFKLEVTDEEMSMSMSGTSTTTDSAIEGKIAVKDVCDVTFQGQAKLTPSETAPVTAPPAGETVIDLASTPMPLGE